MIKFNKYKYKHFIPKVALALVLFVLGFQGAALATGCHQGDFTFCKKGETVSGGLWTVTMPRNMYTWTDQNSFLFSSVGQPIRTIHFTQIKEAIDDVISTCGTIDTNYPLWGDADINLQTLAGIQTGGVIRSAHLKVLRNAVRQLYLAKHATPAGVGIDPATNTVWRDPSDADIGSGQVIRKAHIRDLQSALEELRGNACTPTAVTNCGQPVCYRCTGANPGNTCIQDNANGMSSDINCNNSCTSCGAATCYACNGTGSCMPNLSGAFDEGTCNSTCSSGGGSCTGLSAAFSGYGPNIILPFYTQAQIWNMCATGTAWSIRPTFRQDADIWVQANATAAEYSAYNAEYQAFFTLLAPASTLVSDGITTPNFYQSSGSSGNLSWTFHYQDPDIADLLKCMASIQLCETVPSCTNGIQDNGEGGVDCGGSCPSACCGNGRPDPGEACDNGSAKNGSCPRTCSATCQLNGDCTGCWEASPPFGVWNDTACRNYYTGPCPGGATITGQFCNQPGALCVVHSCTGNRPTGSFGEDVNFYRCNGSLSCAVSGCWKFLEVSSDNGSCLGPAPTDYPLCPVSPPAGQACDTSNGSRCIVNNCPPSGSWMTRTFSCEPSACAAPNLDVCRFRATASWVSNTGTACSPDGPNISCDCLGNVPAQSFDAQCTGGVGTYKIRSISGVCP